MQEFSAFEQRLKSLLGKDGYAKTLNVGPPQRRYRWKPKQVEQLWKDIIEAFTTVSFYYLGAITATQHRGGGKNAADTVDLIDGQQRLATMTLLLAAFRNELMKIEPNLLEGETKTSVSRTLTDLDEHISRRSRRGVVEGPIIRLTLADRPSFLAYAVAKPRERQYLSSSEDHPEWPKGRPNRIQNAMKLLENFVVNYEKGPDDESHAKALLDLIDYCLDNLVFVLIDTPGEAQYAVVFDRSNSRGLSLNSPEQIKSALMARAERSKPSQGTEFLDKWDRMAGMLDDLSEKAEDDFPRTYWLSTRKHVGKEGVYGALVTEIDKPNDPDVLPITEAMAISARNYHDLIVPAGQDKISDDLRDFNRMGIVAPLPLLLAVKEAEPTQFDDALAVVSSLIVRNVITSEISPNTYEKKWSEWAIKVRSKEIGWLKVRSNICEEIVDDKLFTDKFVSKQFKKTAETRYLLRKIEFHQMFDRLPSHVIDVEHVLPKSIATIWAESKKPTRKSNQWASDMGGSLPLGTLEAKKLASVVNLIGNQTLWHYKPNRSEQNSTFADKKSRYAKNLDTNLKITQEIANYPDWSISRVTERLEQLAQKAVLIWTKD